MERLTGNRTTLSNGDEYCNLEALGGENCGDCCNAREYCEDCPIQNAFNKLSAYEDTGLEPREITAREEKIRQILLEWFTKHADIIGETKTIIEKIRAASAMDEFAEIYFRIFGISYDEAARKLHGGDGND